MGYLKVVLSDYSRTIAINVLVFLVLLGSFPGMALAQSPVKDFPYGYPTDDVCSIVQAQFGAIDCQEPVGSWWGGYYSDTDTGPELFGGYSSEYDFRTAFMLWFLQHPVYGSACPDCDSYRPNEGMFFDIAYYTGWRIPYTLLPSNVDFIDSTGEYLPQGLAWSQNTPSLKMVGLIPARVVPLDFPISEDPPASYERKLEIFTISDAPSGYMVGRLSAACASGAFVSKSGNKAQLEIGV